MRLQRFTAIGATFRIGRVIHDHPFWRDGVKP
jgi:hypothetical protein